MLPFVLGTKILPVLAVWYFHRSGAYSPLRVIGGRDVEPDEFTYVVRLEVRFTETAGAVQSLAHVHVCTAAALSAAWTLTAAHCIEGLDEVIWAISLQPNRDNPKGIIRHKAGSGFPTETDSYSDILTTRTYPSYKKLSLEQGEYVMNDVALIKNAPIKLDCYGKLNAADFSTLSGHTAYAVGYGLTNMGTIILSTMLLGKTLQAVEVIIKSCSDVELGLYPTMCVSRRCGESPSALCSGDSGGPLIHVTGKIVGVNSKGVANDCEKNSVMNRQSSNIVGALTPISPYIEWIVDQFKNDDVQQRHF